MTQPRTMLLLAEEYLSERRRLGFDLTISGAQVMAFARFVDEIGHTGPITTRVVLDWVKGKARHAKQRSWARRLETLRPFAKYLERWDPATEFPRTAIFGPSHRRLAPHIYTEQEITNLLAAARRLPPSGTLRPATYEMIFGLIAATGLRISEALHLRFGDIDSSASSSSTWLNTVLSALAPLPPTGTRSGCYWILSRATSANHPPPSPWSILMQN
jgi:site-specific recombinase XerD